MSIYLEQIPVSVHFATPDNSLGVTFENGQKVFRIDYDKIVSVNDIDWLIDTLKSVKSIFKETEKTQQ